MCREWRRLRRSASLAVGSVGGDIGRGQSRGVRQWLSGVVLFTLASTSVQAAPPPLFAYAYPIVATPGAQAYRLELPQDAYGWLARDAGGADIVVVDVDGRQVAAGPYYPGAPTSHLVTLHATLRAVPPGADSVSGPRIQRSTNGDIVIEPGAAVATGAPREFLVDATAAIAPERLEFPAVDRDTSLTVAIDASDNLQDWTTRVQSASIVTLGKGEGAVDAREVKLGGPAARYYRVRVTNGEAPWTAADAATIALAGTVEDAAAKDEAARHWVDLSADSTNVSGQGVDYDYRLPQALPVESLRVTLGTSDNVARLDASAVEGSLSSESLGTLVVTPGDRSHAPQPMDVSRSRRDHIRLHSATPLRAAPRLSVGWRPDRIVFLPEGKGPYRLLVGSEQARRPAWPVADALAALRKGGGPSWRPEPAAVGPGDELAGRQALEPAHKAFDWTRPLLWIVLVLGAVLVLGMAASLLRSKEQAPRQ